MAWPMVRGDSIANKVSIMEQEAPAVSSSHSPAGMHGTYTPISDYALIGDCRAAALISRTGAVDWFCAPQFSSPALFAALLDSDRGGSFAIRPRRAYTATRRYQPRTNILETDFHTEAGCVRVIDLMPIHASSTALMPTCELLRLVEGIAGTVTLDVHYDPRPDYGRIVPRLYRSEPSVWACEHNSELWLLDTDVELALPSRNPGGLVACVEMRAGDQRYFSLTLRSGASVIVSRTPTETRTRETRTWWKSWYAGCTYSGSYHDAVMRSALTLKLLTHDVTGAVVAAPTTSLPECIGEARNWDYRYCWLRDATLTMRAFLGLGLTAEADAFLKWLLHTTRRTWPRLQVLYDVHGESELPETTLPQLAGYRGSKPVRIGNAAYQQVQWDIYGEVVLAAYERVRHGGHLQPDECRLLVAVGQNVCHDWRDPDNGIWEIRGARQHYTYSKLMCWVALNCLIGMAERDILTVPAEFRGERQAIEHEIEARGYNAQRGSYTATLDGDYIDASLLLMASYGYHDANHPRMQSTCRRIEQELMHDGLVYRYPAGRDGLPGREGAFVLAGFWLVDYYARAGRVVDAVRCFERHAALANELGLFSEQYEPMTGEALGNFPQGFSHVGHIVAALALARIHH